MRVLVIKPANFVTKGSVESRLTTADERVDEINTRCSVLTRVTRTLINICSKKINFRINMQFSD